MQTKAFLKLLEKRYKVTRRAIAAIPEDKLDFRPTAEMMSARELALHLMGNYNFLAAGMGENDWSLESFKLRGDYRSTQELVDAFDELYRRTRGRLEQFPDDGFGLRVKPFGVEQKISSIAMGIAEHEIHHRGQLYVYLRLVGVVPPQMYGAE
jgi:uncharacterized damage-inducible protein DinB